MFCPNCGQQNADNAAFCCGCGAPLAQQQNAYQRKPSNPQNAIQSYMKNPVVAILAALLSVMAIFALIDLFDIIPEFFKSLKYIGRLGFEGVLTFLISFAINIFITLSYSFMAVGLWMVFAAGMGNKQFKDKGISFAASGATLSIVSYIVTFAYILFFASRLGVPGSLMAGVVIAVLLFVLAYASTRSVFKQLGTGSITSGVGVAAVIFNGLLFVLMLVGMDNNPIMGNAQGFAGTCQILLYACLAGLGVVHTMTANKTK